MIIYTVTQGNYSDYSIVAVFSSKELAEEFKQKFVWLYGINDLIEEYELNVPELMEVGRKGMSSWNLEIDREGNVSEICKPNQSYGLPMSNLQSTYNIWLRCYGGVHMPIVVLSAGNIWATSVEHAVKIVNEKRIQILANNMWKEGRVEI